MDVVGHSVAALKGLVEVTSAEGVGTTLTVRVPLTLSIVEGFTVDGEAQAVVGMLSGRDPVAMLEALLTAGVRSVVACAPDSPRALPAEVVAEAAFGLGMEATVARSPGDAVRLALGRAGPDDRVVVCGSLYVVAEARRMLAHDAA